MRAAISHHRVVGFALAFSVLGCGAPQTGDTLDPDPPRANALSFDPRVADSGVLLPTDLDGRGPLPSIGTGPCFAPPLAANPAIRPGLCGDSGDDTLIGGAGADDRLGGPGQDRCDSDQRGTAAECERPAEDAENRCDETAATIEGSSVAEVILGTNGDDVIIAGRGNDAVDGRGGDDVVCAGPGDDLLVGGTGGDRLLGEAGRDQLLGGSGEDLVDGGEDDDGLGLGNAGAIPAAERSGLPFEGALGPTLVVLGLLAVSASLIVGVARRRRGKRRSPRRRTLSGSGAEG